MQFYERKFAENNYEVLASKYNINVADASILQAHLWDNPYISIGMNAYNPGKSTFFDIGKRGEKSIAIQQLIQLSGKRGLDIELANKNKKIALLEFDDLVLRLCLELRTSYFEIYFDELSYKAVAAQMNNLDSLIHGFREQVKKGNVSAKDLLRLQSLNLSFKQQKPDLHIAILENKAKLSLLSGVDSSLVQPTESELTLYLEKKPVLLIHCLLWH